MGRFASRLIVWFLLGFAVQACTTTGHQNPGANPESGAKASAQEGSSFEHAVVLTDAKTEIEGVRAEHKWVQTHFPGWHWDMQGVINHDGRVFDIINISRGSEQREIYFDISNWFGKWE